MIAGLRAIPSSADAALAAERLDRTCAVLADLDAAPPGAVEPPYRAIARELGDLPAPVEISRLFQVDMIKPAPGLALGRAVIDEVSRAIQLLHRLAARGQGDALGVFRNQFIGRWRGAGIPLVQALDAESGIGFAADRRGGGRARAAARGDRVSRRAGSPATDSARLRPSSPPAAAERGCPRARPRRLRHPGARAGRSAAASGRAGGQEIALAAASDDAIDGGDFRIHFQGATGPAGAALLGRFCHALPELEEAVRRYLADEAALRPDAIFAEIVHLPQGRVGNVLLRPVLRSHEISFLGGSAAPSDRRIPVTDLLVSIVGDCVRLRSRRLGREVIPRLTTAHNYNLPGLGIYRFLCALQSQGTARLAWGWGALEAASFLPRVVLGKVILACARWRLRGQPAPSARRAERGGAVPRGTGPARHPRSAPPHRARRWRQPPADRPGQRDQRGHVRAAGEGSPGRDGERDVARPGRSLRARSRGPLRPRAGDPVPAQRGDREPRRRRRAGRRAALRGHANGAFRPAPSGSTPRSTPALRASTARSIALAPAIRAALRTGAADGWFFIRYGDPDWHLRLRLHGEPARLSAEVLARASCGPGSAAGRRADLERPARHLRARAGALRRRTRACRCASASSRPTARRCSRSSRRCPATPARTPAGGSCSPASIGCTTTSASTCRPDSR